MGITNKLPLKLVYAPKNLLLKNVIVVFWKKLSHFLFSEVAKPSTENSIWKYIWVNCIVFESRPHSSELLCNLLPRSAYCIRIGDQYERSITLTWPFLIWFQRLIRQTVQKRIWMWVLIPMFQNRRSTTKVRRLRSIYIRGVVVVFVWLISRL